ncbi:MAG: amine oxidase, partial [Mesorhizobium sp.]
MTGFAPTVGVASTHPPSMPKDHADLPVGQKIRSMRRTMA